MARVLSARQRREIAKAEKDERSPGWEKKDPCDGCDDKETKKVAAKAKKKGRRTSKQEEDKT